MSVARENVDPSVPSPLMIRQILQTPLTRRSGHEIVYGDSVRYGYAELAQRVRKLAGALSGLGVRPGEVVAILDWDSHRYLEAFFAVPMMGATLLSVNVRLSPEQISYTLGHAAPKVLLVHADFEALVDSMLPELSVDHVIALRDGQDARAATLGVRREYEDLLATSGDDFVFEDFDENTRATLFYTSGTTGMPKGVSYSHRQLVLHTLAVTANFAMPSVQGRFHVDDVYMPMTPMFHVHAWGFPYVATMMGVQQVYPGRYSPSSLLRLRARERVTFSHCVPTVLHMLLAEADKAGSDLSGWKLIVGGSALPESLTRAAMLRGMDVFGGYGMSETCPFIASAQVDESLATASDDVRMRARTAAGRPLPLVEAELRNESGSTVAHDGTSVGELVLRAPWLTAGYHRNEAATTALWEGGHLHTGDVATIDPRGYLRIADRAKDLIKSGGEWISSLALENAICKHPQVSEAAVIGRPDERWGERPVALVVLKDELDTADARRSVQQHLAALAAAGQMPRYALPEDIVIVSGLPRTSVGKYDKKRMREEYARRSA